MTQITIRPERLLADLDALREIGRCGTGVVRPAYSEADVAARAWLARRFAEAGLEPVADPVGNLFGLPRTDGPCLLVGSHSDSQPEGGWLDGAYGVVAGLELARASAECGGPAVAVVSFQDEEGRFFGLTGSRVWTGRLPLEEAMRQTDATGATLASVLRQPEGVPVRDDVRPERFRGFLEIHIEQGPVLDQTGGRIGVVENIVGIRGERLRFTGEQNHAGTTPMHMRRDAFQGLARFTALLNERFAEIVTPATVWTIGHVTLHPNATSIVPGRVDFTVQWRDAETARLDQMTQIVRDTAAQVAQESGLALERSGFMAVPPANCAPEFVETFAAAAEAVAPGKWRRMPSGALHDASNVAEVMKVAMLFVPSIGGVSHSFDEDTSRADLVCGVEVLARAVAGM